MILHTLFTTELGPAQSIVESIVLHMCETYDCKFYVPLLVFVFFRSLPLYATLSVSLSSKYFENFQYEV